MRSCAGCGDRLHPDDVIVASSEERFHARCHKLCSICGAPIRAGQRRHRAARGREDHTECYERRKEEAQKMGQLRHTYGNEVRYILFLCGYCDSGYLGYEAAERIDWVWEHRIDDLAEFGL